KGKGPDPRNWGTLDISDRDLDPKAQQAALASWNVAQKQVTGSDTNQPEPSRRKGQRDMTPTMIPDPQKPHETCNTKRQGRAKHEKKERSSKQTKTKPQLPPNPIREMVDRVAHWDGKHCERQQTPKAMEPIKQVNLKSYIGLAFKYLEKSDKHTRKANKKK
ncbi:hypothetical protein EDC04DRAFT_2589204, partial [Pisolithus marmoratus]